MPRALRETPPRARRSDHQLTRRRILDAARRLMGEQGPESLTVSGVARAAQINRTTAYQHFRTRDELVGAVMAEVSREVGELYRAYSAGEESPLEELPIQYADFAVWQRAWLQGEALEQKLEYWRRQLAGIEDLALPTDRPRPARPLGYTMPIVMNYVATEHDFGLYFRQEGDAQLLVGLHTEDLEALPDEEVIAELTAVKGFGRWTAEMFLMFRLHRSDVLPVGDLGIVSAVQRLYGLRKRPDAKRLLKLGESWRPYRSVACWYLWQSLKLEIA